MIKTYLRLDLFNYLKKSPRPTLHDQVDLEFEENLHDVLQGCDADYAELVFVVYAGNRLTEALVSSFRKIKLKGADDYQWLTCDNKD